LHNDAINLNQIRATRDQVLPALPREIQANLDEEEYLALKIRLLESLERCLAKYAGGEVRP
jgi:hypothetical protein